MDPLTPNVEPVQPVVETQKTNWGMSFLFLIFGILIGAGGLWGYQWYLANRPINQSTYSSPTPTADPTANWKTYTAKDGFSFRYPINFRVTEGEHGLTIDLSQTEGRPARFISIFKNTTEWSISWLNKLSQIKAGTEIISEGADESQKQWATWTRLPNTQIGNVGWITAQNDNPWESPSPIRMYVFHKDTDYFIISSTYSDLLNATTPEEANFTKTVDQILSTFQFTK